jgi:hypothetical protein
MAQGCFTCRSCGKEARHTAEERPCEALAGWAMLTEWGGPGVIDQHFFCCHDCLRTWADAQVPEIPDAFLRALDR